MPSQHRYPATSIRIDPDLRERAKRAAADTNSNLRSHIESFCHWLVGDTDQLPPRPDPHR